MRTMSSSISLMYSIKRRQRRSVWAPVRWEERLIGVGDERFISAADMESRFALVVGMCLSGAASLIGMVGQLSIH